MLEKESQSSSIALIIIHNAFKTVGILFFI